jgi:DNA-binding response OmpR family regulator
MTSFKKALIVEDEPHLGRALVASLKQLGIEAKLCATLRDCREDLAGWKVNGEPQLVLLDRQLPDGDGLEFCRSLRASGFRGAILALTASGHLEARVEGLDAGADDYLPKPFSWDELNARVRALARRTEIPALVTSTWEKDEKRLRVRGPKGWVDLTPLEFKLIDKLMKQPSQIVGRDELLKEVWGFKWLPNTRTVDHFMGRLRKLFEADTENPRHFITVRGAGYRFEP